MSNSFIKSLAFCANNQEQELCMQKMNRFARFFDLMQSDDQLANLGIPMMHVDESMGRRPVGMLTKRDALMRTDRTGWRSVVSIKSEAASRSPQSDFVC